ncbi:SEC10/PgrA surface exclusion domain-containing protein, partial [Lactobacillus johnsonii]
WYRMPDSNTYYFDNTGHTVKNRWYVLGNTTYYFKSNGHTAKDQKINIDGTNYVFDINGKHEHEVNIYYFDLNNGVLEVNSDSPTTYLTYKIINKDFMNKVLETTSFYGSVSEDLNKYVGMNIEVQLSQMGHVLDSRQFYIASQTPQLSNLKIENNVLSGHVSGSGSLYIVNNGQRYFINDIGTYGSDFSCNILFLNGTPDPNMDVEVMVNGRAVTTSTLSVPVTLQRANVSNVSINENTLSGYVDRNAIVQVISSNGNTIAAQNIPDSGEWFNFDISAYAGSTITLQVVQNGGTVYSQEYDIPKKHALNSIKLPEGYTLSALQEAQDDPSSLAPVSEEGREENKFTSESAIDDQTQVDVSNLTSDDEEELSEFALKLINQAREQFGRPDWEYTDRVQKLANDVATEYVNNNQSGWDGHYVDGIVRAAQNNGLNISENEIEDISCTSGYPYSTMTDLKNLVHNGIVNFLFSNYSSPEYYHAADILSGHKEEDWNDETLNAEFAISFTNVNNIVTVHFISVGSGKNW